MTRDELIDLHSDIMDLFGDHYVYKVKDDDHAVELDGEMSLKLAKLLEDNLS